MRLRNGDAAQRDVSGELNIVRMEATPGAGHFLPDERTEQIAGELMEFLAPSRHSP